MFLVILYMMHFKICISNFYFSVCRDIIDACILILYPAILLNSLTSSRSFFEYCDFLNRLSCHLQIEAGLFLPFQSLCLSFLIALPRIFIMLLLNRSGDSSCLFLVLNLWGKTFIIKYDLRSKFLVDALYQVVFSALLFSCTKHFTMDRGWIFSSTGFLRLLKSSYFFL